MVVLHRTNIIKFFSEFTLQQKPMTRNEIKRKAKQQQLHQIYIEIENKTERKSGKVITTTNYILFMKKQFQSETHFSGKNWHGAFNLGGVHFLWW